VPTSIAQVFHFLLVTVDGGTVNVAPTNSLGQTFDVQTYTFAAPPAVPAAPTNLTASAGDAQVSLSWTASSGATSYSVKRATTSGGPYAAVATGLTATAFTDTAVVNGTTYFYLVSARNAAGESPDSTEASARPTAPPAVPAAPTNLTASAGDAQASLSWTASSGASSYTVKRSTTAGGPYANVATGLTTTSFTDTSVVNGTTYFYVVSASNAAGESANSTEASARPVAPPTATTLTFSPEADTYVDNTTPSTNFGSGGTLKVDTSPSIRNAYLRFTISGVSGTVQAAKLRLFSVDATTNGPQVFATSNTWTESGLTWNNQPGSSGTPSDDKAAIGTNVFVEFDVTPLVAAGNGTYSLVLIPQSTDGFDMASREATAVANRPQLVLTVTP
jgi:hypothetical protein